MHSDPVEGIGLRGEEPKRLALSDGSRLLLDCGSCEGQRVAWKRVGSRRQARQAVRRESDLDANGVSVAEAAKLAGPEYRRYVATRTRAEAEWMRAVSDWYRDQADRLEDELRAGARSG